MKPNGNINVNRMLILPFVEKTKQMMSEPHSVHFL